MRGFISNLIANFTQRHAVHRAAEALAEVHASGAVAQTQAVFIDSAVPDLQDLVAGAKPGERVFVLDMSRGGLEQIAAILAANHLENLASIAIVGHGASGSINVGTTVLDEGDLAAHAAALKTIGAAVAPGGALDLYSCDTAAGVVGRSFIADLSKSAGVRVDAATHDIGRTATGQNWTLDATSIGVAAPVSTSAVERQTASAALVAPTSSAASAAPASPFTASAMQSYAGTLATQTNATGQLFVLDELNSSSFRTDVYNTTTPGPAYTATATTIPHSGYYSSMFGVDSVNGLYFAVEQTVRDANTNTSSENIVMYNASGQVLGTSASISDNSANLDNSGVLTVDPTNHLLYVTTFTGTGDANDTQQNQIFEVSYNPTTHAFGSIPYSTALTNGAETATQGTNNSQTLISSQSDPTFNGANQSVLDEATNQLFYTSSNYGYMGPDGTVYPAENGLYVIKTTSMNQTAVQLTSSTQFNTNTASIESIAINQSQGLVYFTTTPRQNPDGTLNTSQTPALYVIPMAGGTATQLGVPSSILSSNAAELGPGGQQDIAYDAATQSLYVLDPGNGLTQVKLNAAGTGLASGTATSTYVTPSNSFMGQLAFDALPKLATTATGAAAAQNGAAVSLLSNATITDPDSGGYLSSATVQVTQNGTVESGDKLLINGTSFTSSPVNYTSGGATFNISYNTGTDTLLIASIPNSGQNVTYDKAGITTTTAQYASLLSGLQYQDGYTDTSTGTTPTRTFTYHVSDGAIGDPSGINTTTSTINITRTPPTLASGGYTTEALQGGTATANSPGALTGDSDPNGGTLTVTAVQTAGGTQGTVGSALTGTYGTLTLSGNGAYTYAAGNTAATNNAITSAAKGSHPIDSYRFTVSSPSGMASETFAATIDRAPVGNADSATVDELSSASGNVTSNDTDADGDPLSVATITYNGATYTVGASTTTITAKYGELSLNQTGVYTYTADNAANFATNSAPRTDAFTYTDSDGMGGTSAATPLTFTVVPCFVTGTRIRVARGGVEIDVPVEALQVGDLAVTVSRAHRPIRWIGHRRTDCRAHPCPEEAHPIRIAAHAFGPHRPARELMVSPGHSICVDVVGEVLIPAAALANGSTIEQVEVDAVTYWHVELDGHDILLAENLPAESYLEMGNRDFFVESDIVGLAGTPDAVRPGKATHTHADFCRPFHQNGQLVDVVWERLRDRAVSQGWTLCEPTLESLHLVVDGARVDPEVEGLAARFALPASARSVWLVSDTMAPRFVSRGSSDARALGVDVARLVIDDNSGAARVIAANDPLLCRGFHAVEDGPHRWTAGRAHLPAELWSGFHGDLVLRVDLGGPPLCRWTPPREPAADRLVRNVG